jgi:hypothetical protein
MDSSIRLKDMTADEVKSLISQTVRETMEEFLEDMLALGSENFVNSIKQAREDYKKGDVKTFEEVFDV